MNECLKLLSILVLFTYYFITEGIRVLNDRGFYRMIDLGVLFFVGRMFENIEETVSVIIYPVFNDF